MSDPAHEARGRAVEAGPGRFALFLAFAKIGCLGFGGVAALARHVLVDERRFLTAREFAEAFGLASALPGANTVNLATMLGDRFRGPSGAIAALSGLLGAPLIILIGFASLYARFSHLPDVRAALDGAAAAAAGLVLGTSLNLLKGLGFSLSAAIVALSVAGATVAGVPMLAVLLAAVPLSMTLRHWVSRARTA